MILQVYNIHYGTFYVYIERDKRIRELSVFAYVWFVKDLCCELETLRVLSCLRATSNRCSLWTNPFFLPSDECVYDSSL